MGLVVEAEFFEPLFGLVVGEAGAFFFWFGGAVGFRLSGGLVNGDQDFCELLAGDDGAASFSGVAADLAIGAHDVEAPRGGVGADVFDDDVVGGAIHGVGNFDAGAFDLACEADRWGRAVKDDADSPVLDEQGSEEFAEAFAADARAGFIKGVKQIVAVNEIGH